METLQSGNSPGTRIAAGDSVFDAAESVDTKPIAGRLAGFKKVHEAYKAADGGVKKSGEALQRQQARVGEADVTQDGAVLDLAVALPGDGLPRVNPFKPFGAPSPTALQGLGYAEEAKQILALESAVLKRKGLSQGSIAAAKAAGKAALGVQAELAAIPKLEKARTAAMTRRDALAQAWETAFAGLKRAARAAEDDGAKGLYGALFGRAKASPKPKKKAPEPK
ncbi:MAG: hypothetical protein ACMG6S_00595 [Byssovorax sp.]